MKLPEPKIDYSWTANPWVWVIQFKVLSTTGRPTFEGKERPILCSTEMVRAILADKKTQTRRVLTPTIPDDSYQINLWNPKDWEKATHAEKGIYYWTKRGIIRYPKLPYGLPGDILWVRETLYQDGELGLQYVADKEWIDNDTIPENHNAYRNYAHCNIPSIHFPKWAARIWLQIESIKVERLQSITEADAIAEGIESQEWTWGETVFPDGHIDKSLVGLKTVSYKDYSTPNHWKLGGSPIDSYQSLWDSINSKPETRNPQPVTA